MKKFFYVLFWFFPLFGWEQEIITADMFSAASDIFGWPNSRFNPLNIKEGDVIYVIYKYPDFLSTYHHKISAPYVFVSNQYLQPVSEECLPYLDDPKLLFWFAQNPGILHRKLIPIPLGVDFRFDSKRVKTLEEYRTKSFEKKYLLYMNFSLYTNIPVRSKVYELFKNQPYCYVQSKLNYESYLEDLGRSYFVLSPQGEGLDCFRTWETLYMGSIPIVESSALNPLFENLPVLIIDRFEQISEEFLKEKYEEMRHKKYRMEKLTSQYWIEKIRSAKFAK